MSPMSEAEPVESVRKRAKAFGEMWGGMKQLVDDLVHKYNTSIFEEIADYVAQPTSRTLDPGREVPHPPLTPTLTLSLSPSFISSLCSFHPLKKT